LTLKECSRKNYDFLRRLDWCLHNSGVSDQS